MKIGILGTGMVGEALGGKLVARGHEVKMGSRTANNEKAAAWVGKAGAKASQGTFADAAAFGEMVLLATKGDVAVDVVRAAKAGLEGKVLVDATNPLDFSKGMPPTLFVTGNDSLGERIQKELPATKVVKGLNTISAPVMIDPASLGADTDTFVAGNDKEAKAAVARLLQEDFGWKSVVDLGDITASRGLESYLPFWLRLWGATQTPMFNIKLVKAK